MKKIKVIIFAVFSLCIMSHAAYSALILTFDHLTSYGIEPMPSTYGSLEWENFILASDYIYEAIYGNSYNSPSGDYAVSNSRSNPIATITSSTSFNFDSAWFSAWALSDSQAIYTATNLVVKAYNGASLKYIKEFDLPYTKYEKVYFNFSDITKLEFIPENYNYPTISTQYWLMDNFAYTLNPSTNVPEPFTILLLIIAGCCLFIYYKKTSLTIN